MVRISIHALCEEGDTTLATTLAKTYKISIHALCEEGDDRAIVRDHECRGFLSTPSARRATSTSRRMQGHRKISIHALCEEGDIAATARETIHGDFYPRPLRGGRLQAYCDALEAIQFLSTPSARRATRPRRVPLPRGRFLSTPSARRATSAVQEFIIGKENFYPRPLRGGRHH